MRAVVDGDGLIYISDTGNHRVAVFDDTGKPVRFIGVPGVGPGQINYPYGLAFRQNGNLLVADSANLTVSEFTRNGEFVGLFIRKDQGYKPGDMTSDGQGLLYISDLANHQVVVTGDDGRVVRTIKNPDQTLSYPQGLAVDGAGRLWVADSGNYQLKLFDQEGHPLRTLTGAEDGKEKFSMIRGLALDKRGRLYVADSLAGRVRAFDAEGKELFSFGEPGHEKGQFTYPMGLYVDAQDRIYVADRGNDRIQIWGYR